MIDANGHEKVDSNNDTEAVKGSKGTRGAKKGAKGKKAAPKSKRKASVTHQEEAVAGSSFVEPEDDDFEVKVKQRPAQEMKNRKRKSDEMNLDNDLSVIEVKPPPTKRRATRSSVSHGPRAPVSTLEFGLEEDTHTADIENASSPPPAIPKKAPKGGRKRASTSARKASAASTASKASLRATVPDDEDIDAALEADLNRPLTDDEAGLEPPPLPKTKSRRLTRTRPGSRNITASTAPVRRATRTSPMPVEHVSAINADIPTSDSRGETAEEVKAVEIALNAVEHAKEEIIAETGKHMASKTKTRKAPSKGVEAAKKTPATQDNGCAADASQEVHEVPLVANQNVKESESAPELDQVLPAHPRTSEVSLVSIACENAYQINNSISVPTSTQEDPGNETDASVANPSFVKKGGKKRTAAAKKGKASKKGVMTGQKVKEKIQVEVEEPGLNNPDAVVDVEMPDAQGKTELATLSKSPSAKEAFPDEAKGAIPKKGGAAMPQENGMLSPIGTASFEPAEPAEASPMTMQGQGLTTNTTTPPDSQDREAEQLDGSATIVRSATPQAQAPSVNETPKKAISPQSSDAENQPPSSRPSALRPPLSTMSPSKAQTSRIALAATTPTSSPLKRNVSRLQSTLPWTAIDFEKLFTASPAAGKENVPGTGVNGAEQGLSSPEKKLSVEEWMRWKAARGEEKLREDCERLVGRFEGEGVRALKSLEGIVCAE